MENAAIAVSKLFGGTSESEKKESEKEEKKEKAISKRATRSTRSKDVISTASEAAEDEENSVIEKAATDDGEGDTTVETEVAPAVEHTHVQKTHETREKTSVEREIHQDHYHTTIQPLTNSVVVPEKHDYVLEEEERVVDKDDGRAKKKAKRDIEEVIGEGGSRDVEFEEEKVVEEGTKVREVVHHHLHETILPVIEKEVIVPSVTHKKVEVKEVIQENSKHHGVTTNAPLSQEEFEKRLEKAER
ncbi:allergen [Drepanopeziza brunnea f. sp. 'multigermtubi' MB_m1]|uniref:Allergen n=1 Tax=Marssonina brunnea f. sp. multigermtubi (strain MB_m1) TaxID=1072389 RepID=K1WL79_MARBU|nr:allergen [Drepanopeziza brunnea f. sp. 'multigermtubi' MB_m1]EKD13017.1 allergen [Drepanopeziza brunnea f. sp. 'multigermtubi' MB_m1]